jgi:hypothetical protein
MPHRAKVVLKFLYGGFVAPLLRTIFSLFFDKRYLRGRHFDCSLRGWMWAVRGLLTQKVLRYNAHVPWPVSPFTIVNCPSTVTFDRDDLNNFQTMGVYFGNFGGGRINIGRGTYIAPNVGIITTNHDPADPERHLEPKDVCLGEKCWIGMNSVILPGVSLGDHTTVGAGAVVTRSYPEGHCVLAGVPARIVRHLETANVSAAVSEIL